MQSSKITLSQLESFLLKAADMLRGSMDASEFKDYGETFFVPERKGDKFAEIKKAITEKMK